MRPRRTPNPLLPVNNRHLRGKPTSVNALLRCIFLAAILLIISYTFVTYRGPHADKTQAPQAVGSDQLTPSADIAAQSEQHSGSDSSTAKLQSDSQATTTQHVEHRETHEAERQTNHPQKPVAADYRNKEQHSGEQAQAHDHPDATHQVHPHQAKPTDFPDASHQAKEEASETQKYPDATHQVEETPKYPDATHQVEQKAAHADATDHLHSDPVHTTQPAKRPDEHHEPTSLYELEVDDIDGLPRPLKLYVGKVTLVVNVASACGYTDENYKGLESLYQKYRDHGLVIMGFPCNQFGSQESGTLAEIKSFCTHNYHVTFPMFSKVEVNGPHTHPVYRFLKKNLPESQGGGGGTREGKDLVWNFNKYLVDQQGHPVRFFYQHFEQQPLEEAIEALLPGVAL